MTTKESEVDVLAVMDDVERGMRSVSTVLANDMREARDAVAEVFEAAKDLRQRQRDYLSGPKHERSEAKGRLVGVAAERLDNALRNAGVEV